MCGNELTAFIQRLQQHFMLSVYHSEHVPGSVQSCTGSAALAHIRRFAVGSAEVSRP